MENERRHWIQCSSGAQKVPFEAKNSLRNRTSHLIKPRRLRATSTDLLQILRNELPVD